jgi:D-amino-acid oxidase
MAKKIAVIGAGISGMSTAYLLSKEGYDIELIAKEFSPNITSNKAAAFWFPYHIRNDERGIGWCRKSYEFYAEYANNKATGISFIKIVKAVAPGIIHDENWMSFMPENSLRTMNADELPNGYAEAYEAEVPLIETQIFLPWLQQQLVNNGVKIIQREITDLYTLQEQYDIVINCTALGARKLCDDENIIPIRGQVVLLEPGYPDHIFLDNHLPSYIVPRKDATIVGGTFEEHEYDAITINETLESVLQKAYSVDPKLKERKIIGNWAGLRPYREQIRLEREPDTNIIHNYGHGGSGFTLAFGCADSVKELVAGC